MLLSPETEAPAARVLSARFAVKPFNAGTGRNDIQTDQSKSNYLPDSNITAGGLRHQTIPE